MEPIVSDNVTYHDPIQSTSYVQTLLLRLMSLEGQYLKTPKDLKKYALLTKLHSVDHTHQMTRDLDVLQAY